MIPKPEKDLKIPRNYRPISLLNTIATIFEVILTVRLKTAILGEIRPKLFKFRANRSTTAQLIKLVD